MRGRKRAVEDALRGLPGQVSKGKLGGSFALQTAELTEPGHRALSSDREGRETVHLKMTSRAHIYTKSFRVWSLVPQVPYPLGFINSPCRLESSLVGWVPAHPCCHGCVGAERV